VGSSKADGHRLAGHDARRANADVADGRTGAASQQPTPARHRGGDRPEMAGERQRRTRALPLADEHP